MPESWGSGSFCLQNWFQSLPSYLFFGSNLISSKPLASRPPGSHLPSTGSQRVFNLLKKKNYCLISYGIFSDQWSNLCSPAVETQSLNHWKGSPRESLNYPSLIIYLMLVVFQAQSWTGSRAGAGFIFPTQQHPTRKTQTLSGMKV